ncbi:MAG: SPFH domain-containing protein [Fimbriimonadaceae bacterium]|nr:SPFH domain-containing protein [Fimbriimonadaceae bacterium]
MGQAVPFVLWLILSAIGFALTRNLENASAFFFGTMILSAVIASAMRVAAQWEKAIVFRLGRFSGVRGPGVYFVLPVVDVVRTVDTRITTIEIPRQEAITKDNVPVSLDGVIFMRVAEPEHAIIRVQDYTHAIRQYALTTLRDVVGTVTLDELLADREALGHRIEKMVETEIDGWGLEVPGIRIQDIILPDDLKRVMAREASAEREKRANITKSEGDRDAAMNLASAASTMAAAPGALQLRTLQTLDSLGASASNTVVMAIPVDVLQAVQSVPQLAQGLQAVVHAAATEPSALPKAMVPTEIIRDNLAHATVTTSSGNEDHQPTTA